MCVAKFLLIVTLPPSRCLFSQPGGASLFFFSFFFFFRRDSPPSSPPSAPCSVCKGLESASLSHQTSRAVPRRRPRHIAGLPVAGRCGLLPPCACLCGRRRDQAAALQVPHCVFSCFSAQPLTFPSSTSPSPPSRTRPRYSPVWSRWSSCSSHKNLWGVTHCRLRRTGSLGSELAGLL